jgi:hypothetical protein
MLEKSSWWFRMKVRNLKRVSNSLQSAKPFFFSVKEIWMMMIEKIQTMRIKRIRMMIMIIYINGNPRGKRHSGTPKTPILQMVLQYSNWHSGTPTVLRYSEDSDTPNGTPILQLTLRYSNCTPVLRRLRYSKWYSGTPTVLRYSNCTPVLRSGLQYPKANSELCLDDGNFIWLISNRLECSLTLSTFKMYSESAGYPLVLQVQKNESLFKFKLNNFVLVFLMLI